MVKELFNEIEPTRIKYKLSMGIKCIYGQVLFYFNYLWVYMTVCIPHVLDKMENVWWVTVKKSHCYKSIWTICLPRYLSRTATDTDEVEQPK